MPTFSQNYCHFGPRFVKCTEFHLTGSCPRKIKDNKVKCINCQGDHPANYKGFFHTTQKNTFVDPNISYADHLKSSATAQNNSPIPTTNDFSKMITMMENLMSSKTTMMNLLTSVLSKLK